MHRSKDPALDRMEVSRKDVPAFLDVVDAVPANCSDAYQDLRLSTHLCLQAMALQHLVRHTRLLMPRSR